MTSPDNGQPVTAADGEDELAFARAVLDAEAGAIAAVALDGAFAASVSLLAERVGEGKPGAAVVTGLGKSGLIGQKIAATLASTGTAAHFLHPAEALHGDLGRVRKGDVVIALSYGGSTQEVVTLATLLRQDAVPIIAITRSADSDLGRLATHTLELGDMAEACPHNLAPTATTTAMLAVGDALAMTVSRRRSFGVADFQKFHPGGNLGRLLTPVLDAVRFRVGDNLTPVTESHTIGQAYAQAKRDAEGSRLRRPGALLVVDDAGVLAGVFTDGDLRRLVTDHPGQAVLEHRIGQHMTRDPKRLTDNALIRDAVQLVRELRIDEVPLVDSDGKPIALIDVQDLMALKVIEG